MDQSQVWIRIRNWHRNSINRKSLFLLIVNIFCTKVIISNKLDPDHCQRQAMIRIIFSAGFGFGMGIRTTNDITMEVKSFQSLQTPAFGIHIRW